MTGHSDLLFTDQSEIDMTDAEHCKARFERLLRSLLSDESAVTPLAQLVEIAYKVISEAEGFDNFITGK